MCLCSAEGHLFALSLLLISDIECPRYLDNMIVSSLTATHVLLGLVMVFSAKVLYDLVLSPLRHFRGPFLARFSDSYRAILTLGGRVDESYRKWHREWGTAVRVGPNAISIGDPDLIKVIYATKNPWLKVTRSLSDIYAHPY